MSGHCTVKQVHEENVIRALSMKMLQDSSRNHGLAIYGTKTILTDGLIKHLTEVVHVRASKHKPNTVLGFFKRMKADAHVSESSSSP